MLVFADGYGTFDFFESAFPILFIIVFIIVIGGFIFAAVKGASQYAKNEASPVLSTEATIVTKRSDVTHYHNAGDNMHHQSTTSYYVTFQVESGDRMEFKINGREFGMLAEGDAGKLTFQGTRYLKFDRL